MAYLPCEACQEVDATSLVTALVLKVIGGIAPSVALINTTLVNQLSMKPTYCLYRGNMLSQKMAQ
jgi:hypothetical protein